MTVYDSYTILNPAPGKYEADHPLVIGVNQSRVKTTINVPDIFAAGRYYFRGVNTIISGVVASDAGKPAYIEANLQDGEIGAGTLTLLSVHGVEANFPYSIKRVPLFETEIDASEIDTSGLVTKDTFNSTVARIDADIQKGDTDLRLDLDALTSRFTQLSSEVNAELDTFDESLGQIETEVKNLASEVDGYDARITNAENAASSANTVAQAASSAASAAQNTANEAKTEIAPLDAKVTQLETDVETAEVTANTAKTTADEAKTNADDAIQRAINARLEANKANDAVKLVQADLDKLEETVSTGSSDLTALTGRVTTAEGKITTLEGKATTAEADISAVKTTTAHLTDNLNQLTTSVTETKGVVDGLEVKVIDLRAEVDTLKTRTETADNDISGLQTSVSNVGAIATKAQTAASGAKSRADEAYTLAETAKSDAEGATTKANTAQSTADGVKTRVDTIEETTIPGINNRVEALQAAEETLSKSIELLSGSVKTVEENYNTLSDSVGLLTTEVGAVNSTINSTEKSVIGYESGSPSLLSPYNLGDTVALTPDQIAAFGFGTDVPHKLGWSEFSIKPVIKPPAAPGDRSFIRVTVILNQEGAGGHPETSLTATLSGTFVGDEILVWRYFHEIGLFVPYFKSEQYPYLAGAGIYPRVVSASIGGKMYTRPNFSQNVATIHIGSSASDNLSFNGGFSLNRYNVPPYFTE